MSTNKVTVNKINILKAVYPVGSVYISVTSTNPATLFGFGTWAAFGEGRTLVGKASAGTFSTVEATGGAETHTLDVTQIPAHTHRIAAVDGATNDYFGGSTAAFGLEATYTSGGYSPNETVGGGLAHNNLQPYIVTYMFKRTA